MNIRNIGTEVIHKHFHALTHKNFRYFWYGQCVSLIGTWMQGIAQAWLVLTLTNSSLLLGLVSAVQFLPITCFSLFAGIIIDKFPKRQILLITQTVSMLLAFGLSILVFTHTVTYGLVLVIALLLGFSNTIDMPTRQSITIELVGKADLMNAVGLNSTTFNLARIVGPAIGAVMMSLLGPAWCFLLNGVSFLAVIYGLLRIKVIPYVRPKKNVGILKDIKDGISYIAKDDFLAETILLVTIIGIFAYNFNVLIPVLTKNVLHMQEKTYGVLMSCLGIGSLIGALTMSLRSKSGPKLNITTISSLLIAGLLCLIGLVHSPSVLGVLLAITGVANLLFATNCNASLQLHANDEYRARVMSVYSLVFAGTAPIGSLFAGYTANAFGGDGAIILCGLCSLIPCLLVVVGYRRKGLKMMQKSI